MMKYLIRNECWPVERRAELLVLIPDGLTRKLRLDLTQRTCSASVNPCRSSVVTKSVLFDICWKKSGAGEDSASIIWREEDIDNSIITYGVRHATLGVHGATFHYNSLIRKRTQHFRAADLQQRPSAVYTPDLILSGHSFDGAAAEAFRLEESGRPRLHSSGRPAGPLFERHVPPCFLERHSVAAGLVCAPAATAHFQPRLTVLDHQLCTGKFVKRLQWIQM